MTVSTTSSWTTYMKQCSTPASVIDPLAAVGVVAEFLAIWPANLYLHTGLVEVDIAVAVQLKAHHVLHNPMKPLRYAREGTPPRGNS